MVEAVELINGSVEAETQKKIEQARTLRGVAPAGHLIPYRHIGHLLAMRTNESPDKVFLIHYDSSGRREQFTYAQFTGRVNQFANLLVNQLGVQRGDRIATVGHNHSLITFIYFAAWKIGAAVAPQNVTEDDQRIAYIIHNAEAKVLFCFPEYTGRVEAIRPHIPKVNHFIWLDEASQAQIAQLPTQFTPANGPTLEDEALLVYTSGTTGAPKGVVLTQYNLLVDAWGISNWQAITGNQRMMCVLPIHHVNGIIATIITPLFVGGSLVLNRAYSSHHFWERMAREKVHIVSVVPTLLQFSCDLAEKQAAEGKSIFGEGVSREDLSHFRHLICGAGTLPISLVQRFEGQFGFPILHGYGLSETTCYSCFLPINLDAAGRTQWLTGYGYPSIGCPILPNEMAIFDPAGNGQQLAPGERGEICIRGHNVMKYYYHRPDANRTTFPFGWFRSGDEGFYLEDEQGRHFFFITGRIKELINRGGVKFSPFDIEEELLRIPGVKVGLAIAFENDYYGEEIGAYVVPEEGQTPDPNQIIAHCRAKLGFAKSPKVVLFGQEIPVTTTGKYQRLRLRDQFAPWKQTQFRE